MDGPAFAAKCKLGTLLGVALLEDVRDRTVIDFGFGEGAEAVEMILEGAERGIGLDIQTSLLERSRASAKLASLKHTCSFSTEIAEIADLITSIDVFEHFEPKLALDAMYRLLRPGGYSSLASGQLDITRWGAPSLQNISVGAANVFRRALIAWRSDFKTDGLIRTSIAPFEQIAAESPTRWRG